MISDRRDPLLGMGHASKVGIPRGDEMMGKCRAVLGFIAQRDQTDCRHEHEQEPFTCPAILLKIAHKI